MKKLIIAFIVLLAAIWLGTIMNQYPGLVLINVGHIRVETSVSFAVLALIILFIALHILSAVLKGLFRIPERYVHWFAKRNEHSAQQHIQQAVFSFFEDDFKQAETDFMKSAKLGKLKLLSYLGAAKAAQAQQQFALRDKYLAKARKIAENQHRKAIDMIKVRWQVESQQWSSALATLESLPVDYPFVLKMHYRIYLAEQNWQRLKLLLPQLKQKNVLNDGDFDALQQKVFLILMEEALIARDHSALEKIWDELPRKLKKQPMLLSVYAEYLIKNNEHIEAENLLSEVLKHTLDPQLLIEYARVMSSNPAKQLSKAETWLKANSDNSDLLYCLGKLCIQYRLWGKARTYFESSIKIKPNKRVYQALGNVLEHLGEVSAALTCYREGLAQQ